MCVLRRLNEVTLGSFLIKCQFTWHMSLSHLSTAIAIVAFDSLLRRFTITPLMW
jgi:ABC-type transport system involved in Fe-S cluster assembly fused permease/ATPase subunit